ncbi:organic hydroperoxide resistance protein [Devosia sp. YIM 151766]|uniref:organic hydroperoxide resistance protein n=1 Tax=Devosia sp. YIM 151766 TaxID=3017325 RepID=UPI00255C5543|nr:organic hydroperoxide resistance protein [Devosia sp. YIM 151766]WIY53203.1 organic hydroperoxide resistance protein [Devosia sp. YIM 151766]
MSKTMYIARATSTGGRAGHGATDDGVLDVTLTTPKELGGDGARGTNPEQLFAVGYSACFLGAMKAAARKSGDTIPEDAKVTAEISFTDRDDGEGFWIAAKLNIDVPGLDKAKVEDIVQRAHVICPYSEVSRKGFNVELQVM